MKNNTGKVNLYFEKLTVVVLYIMLQIAYHPTQYFKQRKT